MIIPHSLCPVCRKTWRCLPYIGLGLLAVFLLHFFIMIIMKPTPEEMELWYEMDRMRQELQRVELERKREVLWREAQRALLERLHEEAGYDYCEECGQE